MGHIHAHRFYGFFGIGPGLGLRQRAGIRDWSSGMASRIGQRQAGERALFPLAASLP
jgi:hypothetical protein